MVKPGVGEGAETIVECAAREGVAPCGEPDGRMIRPRETWSISAPALRGLIVRAPPWGQATPRPMEERAGSSVRSDRALG